MSIPKKVYYSESAGIFHILALPKDENQGVHEYILSDTVKKNEEQAERLLAAAQKKIKEYESQLLKYCDYEEIKAESDGKSQLLLKCKDAILATIPFCKKLLIANTQPHPIDEFCSVDRAISASDFPFFSALCEVVKKL